MRVKMRIVWTLLVLAVLAGCELASSKDPIIVPEVEDEFYIDLWEELDAPAGRALTVKIESIKNEKCLNYRIDNYFSRTGNRLKISINNIIEPSDCAPGEASVKADVDAGSLPFDTYDFDIDFKGLVVNDGYLSVNNESYVLNMESEHGIVLVRDELLRVRDNTIWGYITYNNSSDENLANNFINDLQSISKTLSSQRAGYYGHFTISPLDGRVFVHQQPTTSFIKTFLYQYDGTDNILKDLVATYRQNHGNKITIKLLNFKGKEF
ncbi:MAG: hypothetical protein IPJ74_02475 [Saprospiraceae bacterium]|nr:hypothetical protein [Saprospiraceae bacterium]